MRRLPVYNKFFCSHLFSLALLLLTLAHAGPGSAQLDIRQQIAGRWLVNDELSDNTDDQVEEAIEAGGGRGGRGLFNNREDFYRGGPPEHELYDRISYDDVLSIRFQEPEFRFSYEDGYERVFHTDGRRRRSTAADFYTEGGSDWSFGYFEDNALVVEGQPRDGGFTVETYTLMDGGNRLRIEMLIQPNSFREPIELTRIFDRAGTVD
jgi:hypothetical protein